MRIGLAGVGHQGRRYAAIVRPDVVWRRLICYPEGPLAESLDDFLGRCDMVICATSLEAHHDIVCAALERGKRVLCEKPLCSTVHEFKRIEQRAEPGQLTVGYTHLWHPEFEEIRAACERRRPAEVRLAFADKHGDLLDWAPHSVAITAALQPTNTLNLIAGREDFRARSLTVAWDSHEIYFDGDDPCDPPPLTRMVNWWLAGTRDYRSELWRRVEPAVLGLCGNAHAREEISTQ